MLSHRMYFSRKQYDKRDEWYLLRVSNRSQFADQEVGRSCSNLEGEGRAWTKAATLTPAIYLVDGRYLIVDRSFPFAMFFDQIHPVCVVQKTEDGQVMLHLLSNHPLPKILSGDLGSENHMRLFQNKITDGFDDLITGLESEYKCFEMENARGQTTTLIPDNGRPYAQIVEEICPHGPPVSGECKSK